MTTTNTEIGAFINAQTEDTTPDTANDLLLSYDASASVVKKVKMNKVAPAGATAYYPTRATIWHDEALVIAGGGSLSRGVNVAQLYNGYTQLSSNTNGDAFTQSFMLKAGTYTFSVLGYKSSDTGKIDWSLDGSAIVSAQDWYAGTDAANTVIATGSITVTGSGRHLLTGTVNGKNGSSSGYHLRLTKYWFTPASDVAENA